MSFNEHGNDSFFLRAAGSRAEAQRWAAAWGQRRRLRLSVVVPLLALYTFVRVCVPVSGVFSLSVCVCACNLLIVYTQPLKRFLDHDFSAAFSLRHLILN